VRTKHWIVGSLSLVISLLAGCSDPYSQQRIRMRWENFAETAAGIRNREDDGTRRLREAGETIDAWWQDDCRRFEERLPTVGDYVF